MSVSERGSSSSSASTTPARSISSASAYDADPLPLPDKPGNDEDGKEIQDQKGQFRTRQVVDDPDQQCSQIRLGQQRGLKINEYGVFSIKDGKELLVGGETEESLFKSVGLPFIPPELREARGEIEAARAKRLPKLIERADLAGDLHVHTKGTDGHASIEEMALAAKVAGLSYIAITDHSRSLTMVHGLDVDRLTQQMDEIDRLNEQLDGITILKSCVVEILEDGSLDLEAFRRLIDWHIS